MHPTERQLFDCSEHVGQTVDVLALPDVCSLPKIVLNTAHWPIWTNAVQTQRAFAKLIGVQDGLNFLRVAFSFLCRLAPMPWPR